MGKIRKLEGDTLELDLMLKAPPREKAVEVAMKTLPLPVIAKVFESAAQEPSSKLWNISSRQSTCTGFVPSEEALEDIVVGDILECPAFRPPKRKSSSRLAPPPKILVYGLHHNEQGMVVAVDGFLCRTKTNYKLDREFEIGFANGQILCMDQLFTLPNRLPYLSIPEERLIIRKDFWRGIAARREYAVANSLATDVDMTVAMDWAHNNGGHVSVKPSMEKAARCLIFEPA